MTQKEWERRLKRCLRPLPKEERTKIAEYYREMYRDKLDAGFPEQTILEEFGSPDLCAARILAEEEAESAVPLKKRRRSNRLSVPYVIGMFFLSVLFIIPLTAAVISVITAFGITTASMVIVTISGFAVLLLSLTQLPVAAAVLATAALGLVLIGLGTVLFIAFFLVTKYTSIGLFRILKWIYFDRIGVLK